MPRIKTRFKILNLTTSDYEKKKTYNYKERKYEESDYEFKTREQANKFIVDLCFSSIFRWSVKNPIYGRFMWKLSRLLPMAIELPPIASIRSVEKFIKETVEHDMTLLNEVFGLAYSLFNEEIQDRYTTNEWAQQHYSEKHTGFFEVKEIQIPVIVKKRSK